MPRVPRRRGRSLDEDDDVPILELVRRGDYLDAKWRAPGRGRVFELRQLVDWKLEETGLFFLVWWKGYALRESTWEPAASIHPVQQLWFFRSAGVFD